ncbi:MAG: ABC transporter ATP-binding protein [Desulfurococcales archaeon]|nr:ABC transporter ATP-binding protein [Desulfurococcales archaeon]
MSKDLLLDVENLKVYFPVRRSISEFLAMKPRRFVRAVDGISFKIRIGESLCLVGESGSGKTTTGKAILGLVPISGGSVKYRPKEETVKVLREEGVEFVDGFVDIAKLRFKQMKPLRKEIQIVFQDPYGSLNPRYTIGRILEEPLIIHGIGETSEERIEMVARALENVKLIPPEDFMERYPHQLSGGQRQRVAIARAFITNPGLVIADEPVSMLDVSIRAEILELLNTLREKNNTSMIFITHDLAIARYACERIAIMYLGKIVEIGDVDMVIQNPIHPYTKALIEAIFEPDPSMRHKIKEIPIKGEIPSAVNIPAGCRFHPRCVELDQDRKTLESYCLMKEPSLEKPIIDAEPERAVACWKYIERR